MHDELRIVSEDVKGWFRRHRVALVYVGAASALVALLLVIRVAAPIATLVGVAIGATPWLFDRTRSWSVDRRATNRVRVCVQWLANTMTRKLPAFIATSFDKRVSPEAWSWDATRQVAEARGTLAGQEVELLQDLADFVVARLCSQAIMGEMGPEVVRCVVLHLASPNLDRSFQTAAKSIVKAFVAEQLQFKSSGFSLTRAGEVFAQSVSFCDEHGVIADWQSLEAAIRRPSETARKSEVLSNLMDPQLSYIVYEMGKASDLNQLLQRKMSSRRLVTELSKGLARSAKPRRPGYQTFLIIKQEMQRGDRYIKARIDAVANRLTSRGTIYKGEDHFWPQSVSVVTLPYSSTSSQDFLTKHFPGLSELSPEEAARAALVVVPLTTGEALYFPEDISVLNPAQQSYYRTWASLLRRDRATLQEILDDYDVSFVDVIQVLTLDFLVKELFPGEKAFLRDKTDRVLKSVGARTLLDVGQARPESLMNALRAQGAPSYIHADLRTFIESYSSPMGEFLNARLSELSHLCVQNARKLQTLRSAA